ncbi:uncharacterized protein LOC114946743 isoform X1 [Nylanderia fulva]|uniref:uncharacterized protein LOC114946743 isoform X1 n=1 Tax=Nylanderia fulva TaxID=613905 RepID=UPI0010FB83DA|nr:uncharacterized protein LOC114946743 isoform X1 [Nylanderia fulva]
MESRVFWFFVIYVSCILRKNAFGESTFANSSMSINNTSQPNENMLKTGNIYIRTAESIETKTKLNGITLKTECSEFEIPLETPKNLSQMMKILSDFLKAKCPRYCIKKEQMETDGKNNSVIDDINLFLFFATNESEGDDNINVTILHKRYCLLDNSPNMKITRHLSIYNRNLTVLDNCEKKKLVHGINLSEYTKIFIDVNVAKIIIKILENFTYAVSSTKINTENNFNKTSENTQRDSTTTTDDAQENIGNNQTNIYFAHTIPLVNSKINKRLTGREFVHVFERSAEIVDEKEVNKKNNAETMTNDFSDVLLPSIASVAKNKNYSIFSLHNNSLTSYGDFKIPQNASKNIKIFNEKIFALDQEQKIQPRSSEIASLNEDIEMKLSTGNDILMQIQNNDQDFSAQFAQNIGDASFERKKIVLDVNVKSNLIAVPGTNHRVLFDLTNNCVFPVKYAIQARSSPFRIINVQPINLWLYPGQTNYVAVDIVVPLDTPDASVNTLTLAILGTEIPEKTVNIYVQKYATSKIKGDDVKPTIDYYYNSNCAGKLDKDRCEKTFWSADIVVQDFDSGLKRVISTPNGLYLRTKFISGTKDRVTFYYLSNCCSTTATITAVDIFDNQHVHSIDVTVWDNLSQGEIAAIVLGALLLLFLIIILIIAIIYCVRRRNSHDMPYTQRYGSRPPARSERTSF